MQIDKSNQKAVLSSLSALLNKFNPSNAAKAEKEVSAIIEDSEENFLVRAKQIENWVEANPIFEPLADVLFDLLLVHFLSAEVHKEDYFDTPEWEHIEQKTLDMGSEMLNLFLYIGEANENEVEIGLEDFLTEFLLVEEDEFQHEYRIYESLIVNQDLMDADLASIRQLKEDVKEDTGLKAYFVSIVLFFQYLEAGETSQKESLIDGLDAFELAVYHSLISYYKP
jgi:hypothetical protein